jgi:hypothetical protein
MANKSLDEEKVFIYVIGKINDDCYKIVALWGDLMTNIDFY